MIAYDARSLTGEGKCCLGTRLKLQYGEFDDLFIGYVRLLLHLHLSEFVPKTYTAGQTPSPSWMDSPIVTVLGMHVGYFWGTYLNLPLVIFPHQVLL